jgi:hypothetical protein
VGCLYFYNKNYFSNYTINSIFVILKLINISLIEFGKIIVELLVYIEKIENIIQYNITLILTLILTMSETNGVKIIWSSNSPSNHGNKLNVIWSNAKKNYPRAKEYQSYIDDLGPGEIDFGNGDTRPVYHHCDRIRNEKALDNLQKFNQRERDNRSCERKQR